MARVHAQRERVARPLAGGLQQIGPQLGQKFIRLALIDQQRQALAQRLGDEGRGIVRQPGGGVVAQIGGKRLAPPRRLRSGANGREKPSWRR